MKYPILIPSLGRAQTMATPKLLDSHGLKYRVIVESKEFEEYVSVLGPEKVLSLPGSDYGSVAEARNFAIAYARHRYYKKHWQMDDDITYIMEHVNGKRVANDAARILTEIEYLLEKEAFNNVMLAGLVGNSSFLVNKSKYYTKNAFCYGCKLITDNEALSFTPGTEEDLDYNLQVLSKGYQTIRIDKYAFHFVPTGSKPGGYTELNAEGKRRIRQENTLKRWPEIPGIVPKGKDGSMTRLDTAQIWQKYKNN